MADPTRTQGNSGSNVSDGPPWRIVLLIVAVLLFAVTALQNSQRVEFQLLFVNTTAPLILALLGAGALGAIIGYVAPMVRRQQRQQRKLEQER